MKKKKIEDGIYDFVQQNALQVFNYQFTCWQEPIVREIIHRLLQGKRHTIVLSLARQCGKTETICITLWCLGLLFKSIKQKRMRACFTAPEKGTSSEIFDRTRLLFEQTKYMVQSINPIKEINSSSILLSDGAKYETFGLFKGYASLESKKTTKEGRTFDIVVRDEMHLGEDGIYADEIEPAMATTAGLDIWIGNGGHRNCQAKKMIEQSDERDDITFFLETFDTLKPKMIREYKKTGKQIFKNWVDSQEKYIRDHGQETDEVQKNLFCKWLVERGSFISRERLLACRYDHKTFETNTCDAGLDWAKSCDSTVVTITDYHRNIRRWLRIGNESYVNQIPIITEFLQECQEDGLHILQIHCDSTGAGDSSTEMLERAVAPLGVSVVPVTFSPKSKDEMAKKMEKTIYAQREDRSLAYPSPDINENARHFEHEFIALEKITKENGMVTYSHPKINNAHDDFVDSYALSIYSMEDIPDDIPDYIDHETENKPMFAGVMSKRF